MIRFTAQTNTKPLDEMQKFLAHIDQEVARIGAAVVQEIKPELMDELQDAPRRRNYPADYPNGKLEWTSERQRRAYWASNGFGAGIPFQRSGKIPNAWAIDGRARAGGYDITVQNTAPGAKFVYGSLAISIPQAVRFQQRFHQITGWQLKTIPVQAWFETARYLFADQVRRRLPGVTGRFTIQTYTRGRRR